jgi:hypothetical protein
VNRLDVFFMLKKKKKEKNQKMSENQKFFWMVQKLFWMSETIFTAHLARVSRSQMARYMVEQFWVVRN